VLLTGGKKAKVRLVELDAAIRSVPNTTNISKKQKIVFEWNSHKHNTSQKTHAGNGLPLIPTNFRNKEFPTRG
jgi:hypothetical protein